jgi:hypothetical protein
VTGASDREIVSPELVLVDPELAAWARERLEERRVQPIPADPAPAPPVATRRPAAPEVGADGDVPAVATKPSRPIRRRGRLLIAAVVGLAVTVATVLAVDRDAPGVRVPPLVDAAGPTGLPPTSSVEPAPARTKAAAIPTPPRRFAWAPRPGASGYHLELFKGRALVFRATTSKPEIVIPRRWRLNGRTRRLEPGLYRWYVWPRIAGRRGATATVQAKFVVPTR